MEKSKTDLNKVKYMPPTIWTARKTHLKNQYWYQKIKLFQAKTPNDIKKTTAPYIALLGYACQEEVIYKK